MTTISGTEVIGRRAAENVLHAVRYAREVGRPINTHITVSFAALGIDNSPAGVVFTELKSRIGRWWAYQRSKGRDLGPLIGVHSHANPDGSRHVHWMTHIPDEIRHEFAGKVPSLLQKIIGRPSLADDAVHIQAVGAPGSLAKYILRGIDPAYADYLHIRPENEGLVLGRRTGVSRAVSMAARKQAGWIRRRSGGPAWPPRLSRRV